MDSGLLKVSCIFTTTLYHRNFFFHPRIPLSRWMFWLNSPNVLVIGAVPFSTHASSYKRHFQYFKLATMNELDSRVKRMKRFVDKFALQVISNEGNFNVKIAAILFQLCAFDNPVASISPLKWA